MSQHFNSWACLHHGSKLSCSPGEDKSACQKGIMYQTLVQYKHNFQTNKVKFSVFFCRTTTNMDIFRDDSAEEILSQYSEGPSEILLPMVQGHHTDTTHTNTVNSLPSTSSGLSGSASHSSSPRSFPSLPSPQTVSAAFSLNTPTSSLEKTPKTKRMKDSTDRLLENINNELHIPMSNNEHFLLSLKDQLDTVPHNLLGLCKIHILDILNHYEAGIVPTSLVPLEHPQGEETI